MDCNRESRLLHNQIFIVSRFLVFTASSQQARLHTHTHTHIFLQSCSHDAGVSSVDGIGSHPLNHPRLPAASNPHAHSHRVDSGSVASRPTHPFVPRPTIGSAYLVSISPHLPSSNLAALWSFRTATHMLNNADSTSSDVV
ncbi:hypothetical protein LY76DRAFT_10218 [Colletotrichum caudatum]|nr:hypothetical protein LY76DRAFT_10218 [Colletotrichum caudatum]